MKKYTVITGLCEICNQRNLLYDLVKRDVTSRYRGTLLDFLWLVLHPIIMISVYSFVFGGVFKSRWANQGSLGEFVIMLFTGFIIFTLFSETVNKAPSSITAYPNFVKKIVFPLELLPLVNLGSAFINFLIGFFILCLMILYEKLNIPSLALLSPLVIIPVLLLAAGFSWGLSALGVFFRDLGQIVGVLTSVMLYLSPIFFSVSSAPESARWLLQLNPLSFPIEQMRNVLVLGLLPDWKGLFIYSICSLIIGWLGLWIFQKSRRAFADVV